MTGNKNNENTMIYQSNVYFHPMEIFYLENMFVLPAWCLVVMLRKSSISFKKIRLAYNLIKNYTPLDISRHQLIPSFPCFLVKKNKRFFLLYYYFIFKTRRKKKRFFLIQIKMYSYISTHIYYVAFFSLDKNTQKLYWNIFRIKKKIYMKSI